MSFIESISFFAIIVAYLIFGYNDFKKGKFQLLEDEHQKIVKRLLENLFGKFLVRKYLRLQHQLNRHIIN
jgi:hypothetical protein